MSGFEAAVTGLGLVTPAGVGVKQNWMTVCAGESRAAVDPVLDACPVRISCRVPDFDAGALLGSRRAHRLDPFVQFALVAAREALADAGLDPHTWDGARVGVVLGTADGGTATMEQQCRNFAEEGPKWVSPLLLPMHLPNMLAGQVAMEFGATGPNLVVATACASGASAIGTARDLLAADRCDVVLTGGAEAMLGPVTMAGFAQMGALSRRNAEPARASRPFDADRDGFVAGEGAGMLVLERVADARARGVRAHGRIIGYGATADAHHMTKPHPHGVGTESAVRQALADAGASVDDVGHVNAHGTSTPLNDRVEALMLSRVLPGKPRVTSTKGVTGHLLGASGAVEAALTLLSLEHDVVPPTANLRRQGPGMDLDIPVEPTRGAGGLALNNSFGFGGQNAVLVAAAP